MSLTPDFSSKDRIVCVTGASSGLGQAIAQAFVEGGAKVVCVSRRIAGWCDGENAVALSADLSDPARMDEVAEQVAAVFGTPDILVNAAGLNPRQSADTITPQAWNATLDLNLATPFFLAQALVPAMKANGWGRILNIASLQSERAFPDGIAYGASKGGIAQLTRAMAEAWSAHGITANALAPGFFPTELTNAVFSDPVRAANNAAQTCIGRNGTMEDITGPALFLCAPAANYITGQILYVDGGFTAK